MELYQIRHFAGAGWGKFTGIDREVQIQPEIFDADRNLLAMQRFQILLEDDPVQCQIEHLGKSKGGRKGRQQGNQNQTDPRHS